MIIVEARPHARSRQQAIAEGQSRYFTGKPCKHGHIAERHVAGICMECSRVNARAFRERDPEYGRAWQRANLEARAPSTARSYRKHLAARRAADRAHALANPKKQTHDQAMRRARALGAVPPWVDVKAIRKTYDACPVGMEVDHIHPLKHEAFCGLHVPWNLQYLTPVENARKNNRFFVEVL